MQKHVAEIGTVWFGTFATVVSDAATGPHWLTKTIGILTALYTAAKLVTVLMEITRRLRRVEAENNPEKLLDQSDTSL